MHTGDCHMTGKRHRPVDRDEARRPLATRLKACGHCRQAFRPTSPPRSTSASGTHRPLLRVTPKATPPSPSSPRPERWSSTSSATVPPGT
ncbi:DUF6233 domain-containing protein [Streptomyces albogriseolus]